MRRTIRAVKLPYLRTRKYTNKLGETWIGYYYEPPRGSAGAGAGERAKPVPLGSHLVKGKVPACPPAEVLIEYGKVTNKAVALPVKDGTIASVYSHWYAWARREVQDGRLSARTLGDYEDHWGILEPVFGAGQINALTQPVLLGYFDRRSSKDRGKREVCFMGVLCSWARSRGYMVAANPVDRGLREQMKVTKKIAPTVPADIYWIVWQCADQLVRDTLDVSYIAATRVAEAIRVPMPAIGATELELAMPKTRHRGRPSKKIPITPDLQALIDRRRALQPHSLYLLFDERGQQLRAQGSIRSRLLKARDLAKQVCEAAGITWTDFTRQQLRPTAVTQVDKTHGREEARKLAGHTTEKQTAHYIRHEAEMATPATLPLMDHALFARVEEIKAELASKTGTEPLQ